MRVFFEKNCDSLKRKIMEISLEANPLVIMNEND